MSDNNRPDDSGPAKKSGYIKLYRSITNHNNVGFQTPFSRLEAWVWLLLEAKFKDQTEYISFGNKDRLIDTPRGSLTHSYRFMANAWGWSKNKVIHFLKGLENDRMLVQKQVQQVTQITICNYDTYQDVRDSSKPSEGIAKGQQRDRLNKREEKKKKENKYYENLLPESFKENGFMETWILWCDYRKEIKKPLKTSTVKMQLKFLEKQPDPVTCVETSIRNSWTGLFVVKGNQQHKGENDEDDFLKW